MNFLYFILFAIIITAIITEIRYKPRLDRTEEGELILWYNVSRYSKARNYIFL